MSEQIAHRLREERKQRLGTHWVRIADTCLLYVMLALGLNIVVGYAGLLDLGYVAFYAVGAYLAALLTSPHLTENFTWIAQLFPAGLHTPWWITIPLAGALAAFFGAVLGAPTLKLRGDYLAIVTLGFGEIVRLLINNLGRPINLSNGAQGVGPIDPITFFGLSLDKRFHVGTVVAMVVFGGIGHIRGVILGAVLLTALPEVLRSVVVPLQAITDGRLDAGILRPLLISLAMIITMLWRQHGLWPSPDRSR